MQRWKEELSACVYNDNNGLMLLMILCGIHSTRLANLAVQLGRWTAFLWCIFINDPEPKYLNHRRLKDMHNWGRSNRSCQNVKNVVNMSQITFKFSGLHFLQKAARSHRCKKKKIGWFQKGRYEGLPFFSSYAYQNNSPSCGSGVEHCFLTFFITLDKCKAEIKWFDAHAALGK